MAMLKMNPTYAGDPQLCVVAGSFVFTNTSAPAQNTIIQPTFFTAPRNANGAGIGQNETVAPLGSKVVGVAFPTPAYSPQVVTNASANTVMLDLRAFPGDIVSVNATLVPAPGNTPGTLSLISMDATVVGIDQVNNYVYILAVGGGGGVQALTNGVSLQYVVYFKDSYTP